MNWARRASAAFREAHGVRQAYVAGAMAGGIAGKALVLALTLELTEAVPEKLLVGCPLQRDEIERNP